MTGPEPGGQIVPEGSVVITPAAVYDKVTTLTAAVDKLLAQKEGESERQREDRAAIAKLDERLDAVEKKVWMIAGAAATLGGTIGAYLPNILAR